MLLRGRKRCLREGGLVLIEYGGESRTFRRQVRASAKTVVDRACSKARTVALETQRQSTLHRTRRRPMMLSLSSGIERLVICRRAALDSQAAPQWHAMHCCAARCKETLQPDLAVQAGRATCCHHGRSRFETALVQAAAELHAVSQQGRRLV